MSFRITLDHIKDDIRNIERLEQNSDYFNELIQELQKEKQQQISNNNNNSNSNDNDNTIDIFDYILRNVDLDDDIDNSYEYLKDIVDSNLTKNNNGNTNSNNDNNSANSNQKSPLTGDKSLSSPNSSKATNNEELSDEDKENDEDDDDDDEEEQKNKKNEIIIKKLNQLKVYDDTFNHAFKFIETDRWLNSKGIDLINENGTINQELKQNINNFNQLLEDLSKQSSISNK